MGSNQPSRLNFWAGWFIPFSLILGILNIWKSIWYLLPAPYNDFLWLAVIFFAISIGAAILHHFVPKKKPDWRFNLYMVFIFAFCAAILLVLDYYYGWWNVLWF